MYHRELRGLSEIMCYLAQCLLCSKQSTNGSCSCYLYLCSMVRSSEDGRVCYTVLPSFLGGICLSFHSTYIYGGLWCARSVLGPGNPMLRTNTSCGSHFHRVLSLEWEMGVYPAIMQGKVPGPVGAWLREPWPSEGSCPWSVHSRPTTLRRHF